MSSPIKHGVRLLTLISLLACAATAQVMSIPSSAFGNIGTDAGGPGAPIGIGALSSEQFTNELWWLNGRQSRGKPTEQSHGLCLRPRSQSSRARRARNSPKAINF